ncbi:hypothetical protein HZZ00_38055 (plasmid) [Streptomyces sp. NEAU-sy36]|uniref:hypothetical protein n=1 Tax=unclassified Streptomyces TaxID=2593676 RepID=UPI0015D58199|nr:MULTISPECIES: hypothetical protein [unclassified Streptomyces]QLJ06836.1 hypothetical protein HZZ00_38055 [Streptomyces sp. NEAU-sy36]
MTTTSDLIQRATTLLRPADIPARDLTKADTLARIATAQALNTLATRDTTPQPTEPWPTGVTARFLTRAAILTGNNTATVDIHDDTSRSHARCTSCGWTKSNGIAYRSEVIEWAQDHATQCTALPQPTTV